MEALEVLYDHYKETFSLSKDAQARRNKSFVILSLLEAFSFLLLIRPEKAIAFFLAGINSELGLSLQLTNTIIQTLVWLLIAYVLIRYVQDMLYVEHQYGYLDALEKKISGFDDVKIFEREGENYKREYPMVSNLIDLFYKMLMPIVFTVINVVRISKEWGRNDISVMAQVVDTVLFAAIFIITWFYFFEIHSKITAFCKKHIPLVDKVAVLLRKILKEV